MTENETGPKFELHRVDDFPLMIDLEEGRGGLSRRFYIKPAVDLPGNYLAAIAVQHSPAHSRCEIRQIVSTRDPVATVFEASVVGQTLEAADRLEHALDDLERLVNLSHDKQGLYILYPQAEIR
jgi:hypothetical protein